MLFIKYLGIGIGIMIGIAILVIISALRDKREQKKARNKYKCLVPTLEDHIKLDSRYNIFLTHGKNLHNVRFLGIAPEHMSNEYGTTSFPFYKWVVVEEENGQKAYICPEIIRFYEESNHYPDSAV